jgi:hypothetical protein
MHLADRACRRPLAIDRTVKLEVNGSMQQIRLRAGRLGVPRRRFAGPDRSAGWRCQRVIVDGGASPAHMAQGQIMRRKSKR